MTAAAVMAIVLFVFFGVGVTVGVLLVMALSARRAHKAVGPPLPPGRRRYVPDNDLDDDGPDQPPWWQARGDG
jgi:hypothetical protein